MASIGPQRYRFAEGNAQSNNIAQAIRPGRGKGNTGNGGLNAIDLMAALDTV